MENTQLTPFAHPLFGELRIADREGNPWFVATDICQALDIVNSSQAAGRLREAEKATICLTDSGKRPYKITIVNEPGLYRLVFASRKKEAEAFQDWVFTEVLPAIRKRGSYSVTGANPDDRFAALEADIRELKAALATPNPRPMPQLSLRPTPEEVALKLATKIVEGRSRSFIIRTRDVVLIGRQLGIEAFAFPDFVCRFREPKRLESMFGWEAKRLLENQIFTIGGITWETMKEKRGAFSKFRFSRVSG